ncbi:tripartite motif-containing protein 16 [Austrofundulus limnaeus]|uniref:Tripartite motif-containing protein 16 n=1 Tax=Austrofundulus limnaeus TaxID=52670 RepID=A0A2I4CTM8_AUSLI|nr:PREDICTED: tripartite motif-containing protein 16-like [Austrofundulus limnaeus]
MVNKKIKLDLEAFSCPICQDLMKDPVTIACGHSYCRRCIKTHWDEEDQRRIYSCPQCRKNFIPRPDVVTNIMFVELVEELRKTDQHAAPAGAEDVSCDVCSVRKLKAVKSCLNCLASYCEKHLRPHHEAPPLQKHQLVEPSKKLQENICPRHDEVMKIFCRTDQQCICYLCLMDQHKEHETVSAAAERAEKQKELEQIRQQIQQRIQEREKDVKLLQQEVEAINVSADKTEEDSEKIFTQLIRLIQKRSSDVKQQLRSQQETEVSRVKELQEKLEQEKTELKRKDSQLEQLSHTEDHNQFLHNYPSVSALSESPHSSSIKTRPLSYFEDVTAAVDQLRIKIQDVLRDTWTNVSLRGTQDLVSEPKSRSEFLKYSQELTLDPNTAHKQLVLSEGNRKATSVEQDQPYPDHPDRFSYYHQILSRETLRARCYWEVEWSGGADIGVTYYNISRDGDAASCLLGHNEWSWSLECSEGIYTPCHNNKRFRSSSPEPFTHRVGVFLNFPEKELCFYCISQDTMVHLHTFTSDFSEPLYPGFWVWSSCGSVKLCQVELDWERLLQ